MHNSCQKYDPLHSIENDRDRQDHLLGVSTGNQLDISRISPTSTRIRNELLSSPVIAKFQSDNNIGGGKRGHFQIPMKWCDDPVNLAEKFLIQYR